MKTFWTAYGKSGQPKDSFFEKWLSVFFFEAFNNKFRGGQHHFPENIREALAMAPYLNGGLFLENERDTKYAFNLTDARFGQIFDFLEGYNFTISEDSPLDQEVAVDPEMIGRVYESLVNHPDEDEEQKYDERGQSGIFYTPRTEIDLMCRLSLVDNLTNHIGEKHKHLLYEAVFALELEEKNAADKALEKHNLWPQLDGLLRSITVLDPACGSGSFLVGMLNIIDDLIHRADRVLGHEETAYERRKRIIGQSLYGVDVKPWAVETAELRLWLQLVIETELNPAELKFRPLLPNLSFKVRYGDSLVQEVGGINLTHTAGGYYLDPDIKGQLTRLKGEKLKFFNNEEGHLSEKMLQHEEVRVFSNMLAIQRKAIHDDVIKRAKTYLERQRRLDGSVEQADSSVAGKAQQRRESINKQIDSLERAMKALKTVKDVPFVWDVAFVEIFEGEKDGFDIVMGNPPYVRQESIADPRIPAEESTVENRKEYKNKLMRSVYQAYPVFFGYATSTDTASRKLDAKNDLYVYFYLHGLSLLNDKGSFCFITSNSWLDVGYGKDLQEFLLRCSHVKLILDNKVKRSFSGADVNTIIALLAPPDEHGDKGLEKTARFVMFKAPFEQALSPVVFEEIEAAGEVKVTPEYRIFPIGQKALLEDGAEIPDDEDADEGKPKTRGPLIKVAKYVGNKWGGKYLRAPDIFWTILKKGKGKLIQLGDIAEVRFGIKTGADNFFYLKEPQAAELGIERAFLHKILVASDQIQQYEIRKSDTDIVLVSTTKSKNELKGTNLLKYILRGENEDFRGRGGPSIPSHRPSCQSHKPYWYSVAIPPPPPIYWMEMRRERYFTLLNIDNLHADHTFYAVYPKSTNASDALCAALNSTLIPLWVELFANDPGGGGTSLQTPIGEIKRSVLVPKGIFESRDIVSAFNRMRQRCPVSIRKEIGLQDRRDLDAAVFELLNLTHGECDAVYEAVTDLVEARLKKADSM